MDGMIEIGRTAEDRARHYLENKGYEFLQSNYRTKLGELDLVMRKDEYVVFVEVKSRKSNDFGFPQEFVMRKKQQKIARTALMFIKARRLQGAAFRFDVIALGETGLEHFENAFTPSTMYTL